MLEQRLSTSNLNQNIAQISSIYFDMKERQIPATEDMKGKKDKGMKLVFSGDKHTHAATRIDSDILSTLHSLALCLTALTPHTHGTYMYILLTSKCFSVLEFMVVSDISKFGWFSNKSQLTFGFYWRCVL